MAGKLESRFTDQQRFDWLRLVRSENVGPRTFRALITNCGGVGAALKALPDLARRGAATRPIRVAAADDIDREPVAARKLEQPEYRANRKSIRRRRFSPSADARKR
jgi:DNA processing protein